jgi:hypothetical protein
LCLFVEKLRIADQAAAYPNDAPTQTESPAPGPAPRLARSSLNAPLGGLPRERRTER